jgi:DOPA 4,5-dioxygenase
MTTIVTTERETSTTTRTAEPTSMERLLQHRATNASGDAASRTWLFHSHAYFDDSSPARVEEARAFMTRIQDTFAANPHVEVHSFIPFAIGPHPRGSFEVLFTREAFVEYVTWMMFARPENIDILVHPLTRSQVLDHTLRAFWLGTPRTVAMALLEQMDAQTIATGRSEESVIAHTQAHRIDEAMLARLAARRG